MISFFAVVMMMMLMMLVVVVVVLVLVLVVVVVLMPRLVSIRLVGNVLGDHSRGGIRTLGYEGLLTGTI